jgi:uncharacterized protein (DUF169 family)
MEHAMNHWRIISHEITTSLNLRYEPVGVSLYRDGEALPVGIPMTEENFKSYCQAVVLAGEGRTLLLRKEQLGCKLGTSVLGFEQDMERFLDDGVLEKYGVGLYATEQAAAETIRKSTYLEQGRTQAAFIAPLSVYDATPQVVVFTVNSEQVMWLLYVVTYQEGGRVDLPQSGGALGGCADITALPILAGVPNITFLGLGCRIKTGIDAGHLMMGIPGSALEATASNLREMAKPIAMLKKSSG